MKNPKTIFIFAYYSLKDPVFQSAVLPYFTDFPNKEKFRFVLLTWEQKKYQLNQKDIEKEKRVLLEHNICWYRTNWHSGSFKLVKKAFDFIYGLLFSLTLLLRYKAKVVYSEGFPGAIMGYYLSKIARIPHFIHTFEPHTQYMLEAGVWTEESWEAKLLQYFERKIAYSAKGIMTATQAMINRLKLQISENTKVYRVPSCVDLDHFKYSSSERKKWRDYYKVSCEEKLLVYIGKFGGMYMEDEIFEFLKVCTTSGCNAYKIHIYSPDDPEMIAEFFHKYGFSPSMYHIGSLTKEEVPGRLSMADFGLVPVRQYPGKRFCSPIKNGEYWACGLPIIIPEGISDDYEFADKYNLGVVLKDTSQDEMEKAVREIEEWFDTEDKEDVRLRCRSFVEKDRSVTVYKDLYQRLFREL